MKTECCLVRITVGAPALGPDETVTTTLVFSELPSKEHLLKAVDAHQAAYVDEIDCFKAIRDRVVESTFPIAGTAWRGIAVYTYDFFDTEA
jgi:hypothetical protein